MHNCLSHFASSNDFGSDFTQFHQANIWVGINYLLAVFTAETTPFVFNLWQPHRLRQNQFVDSNRCISEDRSIRTMTIGIIVKVYLASGVVAAPERMWKDTATSGSCFCI